MTTETQNGYRTEMISDLAEESAHLATSLYDAQEALAEATRFYRDAGQAKVEAERLYEQAEAMEVYAAEVEGGRGEIRLEKLAKTSEGYKAAWVLIKAHIRTSLAPEHTQLERATLRHNDALIAWENAQSRFTAIKHYSDLHRETIRALAGN